MNKNVNPKFLKNTMTLANQVRTRYEHMGVASTQQVRNPLPAHTLVDKALPELISPDAMVDASIKATVTINGRKVTKTFKTTMPAKDILGDDYWETNGVTVQDIQADLERQGFVVQEHSIRSALHFAKLRCEVANVPMTRNTDQKGRPRALYFKTSAK